MTETEIRVIPPSILEWLLTQYQNRRQIEERQKMANEILCYIKFKILYFMEKCKLEIVLKIEAELQNPSPQWEKVAAK